MSTTVARVSYSLPEAAQATGYSESTVRRAVSSGDLVVHYAASKPVVLADDLREWVATATTQRPT